MKSWKSFSGATDMPTFQTALKRERQRLGITQKQAADLLQINVSTWASWENGARPGPRHPIVRAQLLSILREAPVAGHHA